MARSRGGKRRGSTKPSWRTSLARSAGSRDPLPVIVIASDDARTAPAYFEAFARHLKGIATLSIVKAPCYGGTPIETLQRASERLRRLNPPSEEKNENDTTLAFALVDTEKRPDVEDQVKAAKERSTDTGVQIITSVPCYELWTLLHFRDTGELFANCDAVRTQIKREWKKKFDKEFGDKKAQADYDKLIPLRDDAVRNAKKHCCMSPPDPSFTEVYKVIEAIDEACKKGQAK